MLGRRILATAAFVAAASAQLTITNPTQFSWWVAASVNTLAWSCDSSPYSSYTVVVSNSDSSILTSNLALIADVPNYDCSLSVNQQQSSLAVSNSWTLSLANPQNMSDVYASTPFSVRAQGSPYPVSSSAGASGTATSTAGSSTSTHASGAAANYIPVGMGMAAAALFGIVVA